VEQFLRHKHDSLREILGSLGSVVVAYSGGVDSSYLAVMAQKVLGDSSLAITAVSPSLARRELDSARRLAVQTGINHLVVGTHEVAREDYARNDGDRCYWCKTELFEVLAPIAAERQATIIVGTNVDDRSDYRPGDKAAAHHSVRAPLLEAELTKSEIRTLAAEEGLPTATKPASPCLSSRIAYGVRVTPERLRRIDRAEDLLIELGFGELRVRDHGDLVRIEVAQEEVARAASMRDELATALTALGWKFVTLDLAGFRSGSLNEVLPAPVIRREL
jgi:pyridinium-3,5-biscarboxylic acid mononucleotide sulfurtransferase